MGKGQEKMRWVTEGDLKAWASRKDCQSFLPLVIRRLIRATIKDVRSISFPAGDSTTLPGWDGKLESAEETEYIPMGLSLWEMGTNQDIKRKIESDYQKRKWDILGYIPLETTFIFVTPRTWTRKDEWVNEKKKERFWKDVRVYDARDLEEWLEQAPAVGAWLAKHIGRYPENVQSLEDWWNEWSKVTKPPLIPDLVVGGRKEESEKIKNWLNSHPSSLSVQAFTNDEAIAFLSAVILTLSENEREHFLSKSLVVHDQNSFSHITTTCKSRLLLIPKFKEIEMAIPYSDSHHIFIPLSPDNTINKEKLVLSRIRREEFVNALVKMGISKGLAEKYSKDTARILSVLRRQLSPYSSQPDWFKPENARELIPALLIGKWDENKQGDKEIIKEIAKLSYDEYIVSLKKWLYQPDPPILKVGEIWRLVSHIDSFFALSPYLTKEDFEKFKNISLKVLREINPALELEPEKRWMASLYDKIPKYSKELREGIVETLILIAVFGDKVNSGRGLDLPFTSQTWIDSLIHELLKKDSGKLWYSLEDVLPLIAEASPLSFLEAVEDSLSQESPPIMEMFSEKEDAFTSYSAHPSLLWALEGLAWDPNLLSRVTLILGKLARLDPNGKLANRPINSLRAIFLLSFPQTFADLEKRLRSLELLLEREPEIGWNLLISILPHNHAFSFPNKPRWRWFPEDDEPKITYTEYFESISAIVEKVLEKVGSDGRRWSQVMENFSNLPSQEREKILSKLAECVDSIYEGRFELWNELRKILSLHRSFYDTAQTLTEKELEEIEKLYNQLEPNDLIKRFQWLFDDYWPNLPEGKELKDHERFEQIVIQKRKDAIQLILNSLGIEGVINLATQTKNPQFVGIILAEISLPDMEEETLFLLLDSDDQKKISFAQAYIWQNSLKNGELYIKKVVKEALSKKWSSKKIVNLFLALPQTQEVWDLLEKFDGKIRQEYWEKLYPRFFDLPTEEKLYGLKQLIEVKRHFMALYTASMFKQEIPAKFIAELLKRAASEKSIDDISIVHPWDIEELFKILDQSGEIENDELVKLEWLYLPILARVGSSRPPRTLHQELANNPEFFVTVIRYAYKPRKKDFDEEEKGLPEKLKRKRARLAHELLHSWKTIPGSDENGKIDYQKLKDWVDRARSLCKEQDRLEICDEHIGQVLAYALPDQNGNWPQEEICKIVEEVGSKELDQGFIIGVFNKRGVVWKSPFEGGKQERMLAEQYRNCSERLAIQYPRSSAIFKKVAENYENEAQREDKEAQKRDLEE